MNLHIFGTLFLFCFYSVNSFSVSSETMAWYQAANNTECCLYGLNRTGEFNISQVSKELRSIPSLPETWIGAQVEYTNWYSFLACYYYRVRKNKQGISVHTSDDPIRDCVIHCNNSASFYMTTSKCYCEEEVNEDVAHSKPCQHKFCPGGQGDLCGNGAEIPIRHHLLTCLCKYSVIHPRNGDNVRTENSNPSFTKSLLKWGVMRNKKITDCVLLVKNNSLIITKTQPCQNDHYALCTSEPLKNPNSSSETAFHIINTSPSSVTPDESTTTFLHTVLIPDKRTDFTKISYRDGTNELTTNHNNFTTVSFLSSPTNDIKTSNGNTLQWNSQELVSSVDSLGQNVFINSSLRNYIEISTLSSFTEAPENTKGSTNIAIVIGPVASAFLVVVIMLVVFCLRHRIQKKSVSSDQEMQENVSDFNASSLHDLKKKGVTDIKTTHLKYLPGHNNDAVNGKPTGTDQDNFYDILNAKSKQTTRDVDCTYDHTRIGTTEDSYGSLLKEKVRHQDTSDYDTMLEARGHCGTNKDMYDHLMV